MRIRYIHLATGAIAAALLLGCDRPKSSANAPPSAGPAAPVSVAPLVASSDGGAADAGSMASAFEVVVGDWHDAEAGGATGLEVDGSKHRHDAFYPLAMWKEPPPPGDLRVSVRFYPIAGTIDQAAGIAFGISSANGAYHGVRANALEDNLLYFTVTNGKRTVIATVGNIPTKTRAWHTLVVELRGKQLDVRVDDAKRFEKKLEVAPVGRVGLWSKADSEVLFADFAVTPL